MARDLGKRLLVFVIAYLVMSTILGFVFQEDEQAFIEGTVTVGDDTVSLKILYETGEEAWASGVLAHASTLLAHLSDRYGTDSPHGSIAITSATQKDLDGYFFETTRNAGAFLLATEAPAYATAWALSLLWMQDGTIEIPLWVEQGMAAFMAYEALLLAGMPEEAAALEGDLLTLSASYEGKEALSDIDEMPGSADDDGGKAFYLSYNAYTVFRNLHEATSAAFLREVYAAPYDSQNPQWDSGRYVDMVVELAESEDIMPLFSLVFSDDVQKELLRWKIMRWLEYLGAAAVIVMVFLWAFWDAVRTRLTFLDVITERNATIRALKRRYGSKQAILMELEAHFRRRIPDEEFTYYAKIFYEETLS